MMTEQTEPGLGSPKDEEPRRGAQRRKAGEFVIVAALVVVAGAACSSGNQDTTTDTVDQPSRSVTTTGSASTTTFTSGYLGYLDLTTGETSTSEITPHNSAIDVSPGGDRLVYSGAGVLNVADLDGSNVQTLERTIGDPTGAQWSPDGSSIVYQDGGTLYLVDVGSGKVRPITDLQGLEAAELSYVSATFDPNGDTVLFSMPTEGGQGDYGLWSAPVTGGEPTLVRRAATFGDVSPDGTQIAFVEDGGFGDLFVAPTAGGKAQKLATGEIVVPRWSPDGTRIAYNDGSGGVYVVDVETGERTLVAETDHLPAWVDDDTLSLSP
jgi:Tol biopolymer transport system component